MQLLVRKKIQLFVLGKVKFKYVLHQTQINTVRIFYVKIIGMQNILMNQLKYIVNLMVMMQLTLVLKSGRYGS